MNLNTYQAHGFHLVSPSPWPMTTSTNLLSLTTSAAYTLHFFKSLYVMFFLSLTMVTYSMWLWFSDVMSEGTYKGNHTLVVQNGMHMGVMLFIMSEVFFFLAMFWAFFHNGMSPDMEIGSQWPPLGMQAMNPFELPLLNTIMLLSSGITVTQAHHSLMEGDSKKTLNGLVYTIMLAVMFTMCQGVEYSVSSFTMSDGMFGTCFYFATGFHGLHVMMGTIFMVTGLWSVLAYHLTNNHHLGLESGMLYWHFVDVVWLFLYMFMYYWGS